MGGNIGVAIDTAGSVKISWTGTDLLTFSYLSINGVRHNFTHIEYTYMSHFYVFGKSPLIPNGTYRTRIVAA